MNGIGRVPDSSEREEYWLRQKLQAAIQHLRDIEDLYRQRGGTPEGFNMIRADRARECYAHIIADFVDGKVTEPTLLQAAYALHERVEMDESVGICLSERAASLQLDDALARQRAAGAQIPKKS